MSLDFSLHYDNDGHTNEVFCANITHNLNVMAAEVGLYEALWHPEDLGFNTAEELTLILQEGLDKLLAHPEVFTPLNPPNGWGTYGCLLDFTRRVLAACRKYPSARVSVSR